jgi:ATP-binding cassette, subfamily B, bacterial
MNNSEAWKRRLSAMRNIPPVMKMVWDSAPVLMGFGTGLRVVSALLPLAMLSVSKLIIDDIVVATTHRGTMHYNIWVLLGIEFGLVCAGNVMGRIVSHCDALLAEQFTKNMSVRIMEHATRLDLASFEDPVFADKLERARVQSTDRLSMLSALGQLIQQAVTLASLAAGVCYFSPWLLLLLVGCTVPAFLGESHFAFLGYQLAFRLTPYRRELDYLRQLGASKDGAKEVKIFGLGKYLTDRYREIAEQCLLQVRALQKRRLIAGTLLAILGSIGYYLAYALVVFRTLRGQLSLGDLTFLAGAIAGSSQNIQALFSTFSGIADQALFLTDLLEFFAVKPRIREALHALPAPRPIRKGFEFQKVCFQYPGSERLVINNLDFNLEPGDRVALIGENGQGKTTFVKLLCRLYDPTSGRILLDGNDLRDYSVTELGREIGVIFQDFMRYEMTARENVAVGLIDDLQNEARVIESAKKSMASEVIERLPHGLDQLLGRRFEGGVDLSGGEWQKFALARAYMRDAQLLILDEPTAALDARSEYEVFCRFAELTEGKMALLISHRFSTVRMVDRILVLEGGSIREHGTHDDLMAKGGRYAEMFDLQAAGYR